MSPGRKSDVLDSPVLQQFMSFGRCTVLSVRADQVRVVRPHAPARHADFAHRAALQQHGRKPLTQMNIQLANVIPTLAGETGQGFCAPSSPVSDDWP